MPSDIFGPLGSAEEVAKVDGLNSDNLLCLIILCSCERLLSFLGTFSHLWKILVAWGS